jgi:hypothetical protein
MVLTLLGLLLHNSTTQLWRRNVRKGNGEEGERLAMGGRGAFYFGAGFGVDVWNYEVKSHHLRS